MGNSDWNLVDHFLSAVSLLVSASYTQCKKLILDVDRLFGHEVRSIHSHRPILYTLIGGLQIVMILCGVVWGLWIGFAIVCAGTLLPLFRKFSLTSLPASKEPCSARSPTFSPSNTPFAAAPPSSSGRI